MLSVVAYIAILIPSFLLIQFFYKAWWKPIRIQKRMRAQGIKGPSYNFLHGNTKEVQDMKIEATKTTLPTLSNEILPRVQPHIYLWTKLYGRNFLSWHGDRPELHVTEPDLIKEVLLNKNGVYKKSVGEKYMHKVMGDGLGIAEGKKWMTQRKLANHAFQIEKLKHMVPTIVGSVQNMLEKWSYHEGKEIDVHEEFRILTSDVLSKTAFGSSYVEGQKIFEKLGRLLSLLLNYYTNSEADELEKEIRESFMQIIRKRIEKKDSGELNYYGSDYLGLLVAANQETDEEKKVTIDTLIDECKTAYFAGQDTTMALLSWVIFVLAIHTDWQEKARKEVFDLFDDKHPTTSDNNLAKMKIMTMIVNETFRLYPPALTLRRLVPCEVRLGKILLPPQSHIVIPTLVGHTDPQIWGEDVHVFRPDRFAEGVAKAATKTNVFLPFGMGPRICVAQNFAGTEAKLALSMILQRYSFSLSPSYVHCPIQSFSVFPQQGIPIIIHKL
ncbi:hypothetical protein AQUCO_01200150v1 [Aquilegia coerulea]|uniref:Cytochrome P450 n=1 Tax=Aquilegia coerulea TaxID=218851 RepID=A0A2G5E4L3_AQUCA|nr:hypothetical protein AQUCO_01200150v1 [Aquilegia coerulea]